MNFDLQWLTLKLKWRTLEEKQTMIGRCFWVDLSWIVPQMKGFSLMYLWIHLQDPHKFGFMRDSVVHLTHQWGVIATSLGWKDAKLHSNYSSAYNWGVPSQMKQRINIVSQACCTCQFKGTFWFTWKTQPERRMWKFLQGNTFYEWRLHSVAVNSGLWTSAVILWKPVDACAVRRHLRLISSQSPNQI